MDVLLLLAVLTLLFQCRLNCSMTSGGIVLPPLGQGVQGLSKTTPRKSKEWLALSCQRNLEKHTGSINCSIQIGRLPIRSLACVVQQHLAMAWLQGGHNSLPLTSASTRIFYWPYGTTKGWASPADHFGTPANEWSHDKNQKVLDSVTLPLVHHGGGNWHLLFFNSQHGRNRGIFQEVREDRQLFNLLYTLGGYTKHSLITWIFEVLFPAVVYARDTWNPDCISVYCA